MWRILDRLYLGNRTAARDRQLLHALGITHIVNCAEELPCEFPGPITYLPLGLCNGDADFHGVVDEAVRFIEEGRAAGGVLVHCAAAISRSPAVILAYLCHSGQTLEQAAAHLGQITCTDPDPAFLMQLAQRCGRTLTDAEMTRLRMRLRGMSSE